MTEKNRNAASDMQLVVFRLGNEEFGVDISQIREIIRVGEITMIPQAPDYVHGVINLRGQVTTVVNLRRRLGLPDKEKDGNSRIVIVEVGDSRVGIMVDSVAEVKYISGGQVEVFSGVLAGSEVQSYILGVCKLKDHLLILVDLENVLEGIISDSAADATGEGVQIM